MKTSSFKFKFGWRIVPKVAEKQEIHLKLGSLGSSMLPDKKPRNFEKCGAHDKDLFPRGKNSRSISMEAWFEMTYLAQIMTDNKSVTSFKGNWSDWCIKIEHFIN